MTPRARVAALLAPLALVAGLVMVASPAEADGATVSAPDVVLYDQCATYPVTYSGTFSATGWRLQLMIFDPNGLTSQGLVVDNASGGAPSGTLGMYFCGSETPGTWTITSTGGYVSYLGQNGLFPLTEHETTFTVRRAQTTTTLSRKPLRNGRWKVRAAVREEGPQGFFAPNGAQVELQQLVGGQWTKLPRSVLTTSAGKAAVTLRLPARTKLRGVTTQAGNYDGSVSAPITLKRR